MAFDDHQLGLPAHRIVELVLAPLRGGRQANARVAGHDDRVVQRDVGDLPAYAPHAGSGRGAVLRENQVACRLVDAERAIRLGPLQVGEAAVPADDLVARAPPGWRAVLA